MSDGIFLPLATGTGIGIAAKLTMDVLGTFARKASLTAGAKAQWIGRWYIGISRGQFTHANIDEAPVQSGERRVALVAHYLIGITLAIAYLLGTDWIGVHPESLLTAVVYGFATCVFPWFLMYPAIGFGFFGLKGPKELKLVTPSVVNHLFYGMGVWWALLLAQLVSPL